MGIKRMQGVAAHIEYLKKDYDKVEFVNCKFWKDEICYNTLSTKYGEGGYTKRGCMNSIPMPAGSRNKRDSEKSSTSGFRYNYTINYIKKSYFNKSIKTIVKVDYKPYNVECVYY